ncbi:hypothetical protein J6590_004999 [Homalodisca vitripennis]|nr:hypothetical protein J6590_004999 [Homalodisca vitripennis]
MDVICPLLVWALGRYVRLLVCIAQSTNLCYCERTNIVGTMAATIPTITLNNGRHMPAVGLGTWQCSTFVTSGVTCVCSMLLCSNVAWFYFLQFGLHGVDLQLGRYPPAVKQAGVSQGEFCLLLSAKSSHRSYLHIQKPSAPLTLHITL